jgi:phosphatidate phosphatase APP1
VADDSGPEHADKKGLSGKAVLQALAGRIDDLSDTARVRLRRLTPFGGPPVVLPYLGYGTGERLALYGRVLREHAIAPSTDPRAAWRNLLDFYRRLESDEVPGARLVARFEDQSLELVADREGYFSVEFTPRGPLPARSWHEIELELLDPRPRRGSALARGQVLIPPPSARFGVISDIDDTILWTNVKNRLRMVLTVALGNAQTRKPFKGVAAFYRALHKGVSGAEENPFFYVSKSPWNLYTPLLEFLEVQRLPRGPLLLRDYGPRMLLGQDDSHKAGNIERILQAYPHLPFVLIGDSGEQDPEIYADIARRFPGRVRAIYIRSVSRRKLPQAGYPLILAPDSLYAAAHAAAEGLIQASDLRDIRSDSSSDASSSSKPLASSGALK